MPRSATAWLRQAPAAERIVICSPDKDLAQLVEGERIICLDRCLRQAQEGETTWEEAVIAKYGVALQSIPGLLSLTGGTAGGILMAAVEAR